MKTCSKCQLERPLDSFAVRADTGKLRSACRDCITKDNLNRYHTNPATREAHRKASRKHGLKKYGISQTQFDEMFDSQAGRCAICANGICKTDEDRYLSTCVDHDHKTGKVRGLLCWDCNVGLGKFFDNTDIMQSAITYLQTTR